MGGVSVCLILAFLVLFTTRMRCATFTLLNPWNTQNRLRLQLYPRMVSMNCPLVLFVLVSCSSSLSVLCVPLFVPVCACSLIYWRLMNFFFSFIDDLHWFYAEIDREIGSWHNWDTYYTVWPCIWLSMHFKMDLLVLPGWFFCLIFFFLSFFLNLVYWCLL